MRAERRGERWGVTAVIVGVALALSLACSSLVPDTEPVAFDLKEVGRCKKGTLPCGNGCMPQNSECCDDGTRHTSSYCIDPAGGPCQVNDRKCNATASLGSGLAAFCCGNTALSGSVDCPDGQHHCGDFSCKPIGQPCCPETASAGECPYASDLTFNGAGCLTQDGMLCGVKGGKCTVCPNDTCCAGAVLPENGFRCIPGSNVCRGTRVGGSSSGASGSSGGNNCRIVWDCGASTQCGMVYGTMKGSAPEPNKATCDAVCKSQGACTCQGCS